MKKILFALALVFFAVRYYQNRPFALSPGLTQQIFQAPGKCHGQAKCRLIYVAPWCPACHQMMEMCQSTLKLQTGVRVIIGLAESGAITKWGRQLELPYWADESEEIFRALKGSAVPFSVEVTAEGMVVNKRVGFGSCN